MESDEEDDRRKRKRSENLTQQQIKNIIIGSQGDTTKNQPNKVNYSTKMLAITKKEYKHLFYLSTTKNMTRVEFADIWNDQHSEKSDVIVKTSKGFLLKTDNNKNKIKEILSSMVQSKVLTTFKETQGNMKPADITFTATYSCVIASVERDIPDEEISQHLTNEGIIHRFCKRIKSQATNNWTTLIRIITGDLNSFEKLLNYGLPYKYKVYPVFPSKAPDPLPVPCGKCSQFTHTTDQCPNPIICQKCKGKHHTNSCTTSLPEKCAACNSEDHQAWSTKCPKRPLKPIEGIPSMKIKTLNKISKEIHSKQAKKSRIHEPLTIHDHIIETYVTNLNENHNIERQELINKLKKRFVDLFRIDTTAVFSGNRLYILMFDLDEPANNDSPTEPADGLKVYPHG